MEIITGILYEFFANEGEEESFVVILDERIVKTRRILPVMATWKLLPVFFMSVLPMKATWKSLPVFFMSVLTMKATWKSLPVFLVCCQ
jgi:hypothetical protein